MGKAYVNANVITVDAANPRARAFTVEGEEFGIVGSCAEVEERARELGLEVVDLGGATVVPGFNDAHMHLLNYAYSMSKCHLEGIDSIDGIVQRCRDFVVDAGLAPGQWLVGCGWNHYFFPEPRFLERTDLDRIATDRPILLTRICEHTVVVNSRALEVLGIGDDTPDPAGGEIARDAQGHATGVLRENARYLAYAALPAKSVPEIKDLIVRAMDVLVSLGLTSVQTDDFETFSDKDWTKVVQAYRELEAEGRMKLRVYEQCLLPSRARLSAFIEAGYRTGWGDDLFRIGPLKLLTDGSMGPRSACFEEPYSDDPGNCGIAVFAPEELNDLVTYAQGNGFQVACHAIGDRAMRMVLDAYDAAQRAYPRDDARNGIVHVQFAAPDIFERMLRGGIVGYVQPVFVQADLHCAEDRVGPERIKYAYRFHSMKKMGIRTALSSDCPIESPSPIDGMYVAATRTDYNGFPEGGWFPEERIPAEEAIEGYTLDAAYAQFAEGRKGSVEPGKLADFAVLSADPCSVAPERLREVGVLETYLGGRRVFAAEA